MEESELEDLCGPSRYIGERVGAGGNLEHQPAFDHHLFSRSLWGVRKKCLV